MIHPALCDIFVLEKFEQLLLGGSPGDEEQSWKSPAKKVVRLGVCIYQIATEAELSLGRVTRFTEGVGHAIENNLRRRDLVVPRSAQYSLEALASDVCHLTKVTPTHNTDKTVNKALELGERKSCGSRCLLCLRSWVDTSTIVELSPEAVQTGFSMEPLVDTSTTVASEDETNTTVASKDDIAGPPPTLATSSSQTMTDELSSVCPAVF
jgi:hypothetical protein